MERALGLLRAIALSSDPLPLSALAEATSLNRQTAWRLLLTLEHEGFVDRDASGQSYVLGREIHRLATVGGHDALVALARPVIDELARTVGEAAYLDVPTLRGLRVLYESQPPGRLMPSVVGRELPAHCSAAGKLWLAYLPPGERAAQLLPPLDRWTPSTVTDPVAIERELQTVRERGLSVSRDEYEEGWTGIGAPAFDEEGRLAATVTLWAVTVRIPPERIEELAAPLLAAGQAITSRLALS